MLIAFFHTMQAVPRTYLQQLVQRIPSDREPLDIGAVYHVYDCLRIRLVIALPIRSAKISDIQWSNQDYWHVIDTQSPLRKAAHRIRSWPPMSQTLNCTCSGARQGWPRTHYRCEGYSSACTSGAVGRGKEGTVTVKFLKVTVSMLSPIVGTVLTTSPSRSISAEGTRTIGCDKRRRHSQHGARVLNNWHDRKVLQQPGTH